MTELEEYLAVAGFAPRAAQTALYEHLISATPLGVIAQAGTGTGKSAAIIAAAAHKARLTGRQSIVVTPTLRLMTQYQKDSTIARKAYPDLQITELRGRAHYHCEIARASAEDVMGIEYTGGCEGSEGGCTASNWENPDADEPNYRCDYQQAKWEVLDAQIVVTNADMLIVNDRILEPMDANFFDMEGALYVDEAHTLEQKLRDWASRSLWWKSIERFNFAGTNAPRLAEWLKNQKGGQAIRTLPATQMAQLQAIAAADVPEPRPKDGLAKQREVQDACIRILGYLRDPHDNAVLHIDDGSLRMDWVNIGPSAGSLLSRRSFGLVSATIPKTMASALGVPAAPFINVGHPFDYSKAFIGFSAYGGDYRSAQHDSNFEQRYREVLDLIQRSKGGALLLFSSFRDLERVAERIKADVKGMTILEQERDMEAGERDALADKFVADGNAILLGSATFATGFDCPGWGLRCVIVWKLPYPAVDPVQRAIMNSNQMRYNDAMKVSAVQAIGRLIRTESDSGVVWVADGRGRRLLDPSDPLTSHLSEFSRLP